MYAFIPLSLVLWMGSFDCNLLDYYHVLIPSLLILSKLYHLPPRAYALPRCICIITTPYP